MRHTLLTLLILQLAGVGAIAQQGWDLSEYDYQPTPEEFDATQWPYDTNDALGERWRVLAERYPRLLTVHNIGSSAAGRDLWVLEITNLDTGAGETKPAVWMDGNLHPDELSGRRYLRYFIERALATYGKDPRVTELVDTRTFYVVPVLNPDAGDRVLTRHPAWPGYVEDGHPGRDLNGDGYITEMRWKESPEDGEYITAIEGVDPFSGDRSRGGYDRYREADGEREPTDFNRNWSAEWRPEEPGAGPFPFSQPEIYAAVKFVTDHPNLFFFYNIHSGGGIRNYQVRPLMNHPYQEMHHEDNDFYVRLAAIWAAMSDGGLMESNFYSFSFTGHRLDEEGNQLGYISTMTGFSNDWAYMHGGMHSLTPEAASIGKDYDGDNYITGAERRRYVDEAWGDRFTVPWRPYQHAQLGEIEIGGGDIAPLDAYGDKLLKDSDIQFNFLLYIAGLSPLLRIDEVTAEPNDDGTYRISARLRNDGWLSTYVTRQAIASRRDYRALASISIEGGEIVEGASTQEAGHLLGKFAYIREWSGSPGFGAEGGGDEQSMATVQWDVRPTGGGPLSITVRGWANRAGRDERTITVER